MPKAVKKNPKRDIVDTQPSLLVSEIPASQNFISKNIDLELKKVEADEDERRLFYVALTRAKESVTITYSKEGDDRRENLPSTFISDIKSELMEVLNTSQFEEKYKNDLDFQFKGINTCFDGNFSGNKNSLKDQEFVRDLFLKQGLSPTALNNYLDCPWKYFYQNLIRIPSAPSKHQSYGIAIHGALSDFFNRIKEEEPTKENLIASFVHWMHKGSFDPREFEEIKEKGNLALGGWFDTWDGTWNTRVQTEYRINGILLSDDIRLTGVLDKIEWNDDESVRVVDYKTGKPKTRNALLGNTKDSDGNYYRQLIFYKLLLKYFKEGVYHMNEGVIDFIEPDEKGNYHREIFQISDEEVLLLEQKIHQVADEILSLSFWDSRCSEKDCEFCGLRDLMNS